MNEDKLNLDTWETNYQEAKAFFEKRGRFPKYWENRKLRQWALSFHNKYGESHPEKVQMLQEIGYECSSKWELWDKHFAIAKEVIFKTGKAPDNKVEKDTYRYFSLWIVNSGKKYPERMDCLAAIGFKAAKTGETVWDKNYATASAFFRKHKRFPSRTDNVIVAEWARVWVSKYAEQDPEKMQMLREIGYNN